MLLKQSSIHIWIPNIFQFKGGIQVYSEFFLKALNNFKFAINYKIFLKIDYCKPTNYSFLTNMQFYFAGSWPLAFRTLAFTIQLLGYGLWQRPNLVITTHLNFTVAAYWLKRITGIPYWTVAHGIEAWNIDRTALQKALQYADKILAVSTYTRDRLLKEQNIDPTKISLLPNTFDANRFQIAPKPQHLLNRYGLSVEQPIILTVARLDGSERYKGYDQVIQSLPEICRHIPNIHYILVGKGCDRPRIEKLIAQLQLQDYVTLAGFVPEEELCAYYNLCDIFAMPSKREGFGIVYLEALSCGKPTLGGNQDGAIDALCNGKLGALIDPDDIGSISKTIIQILQGNYPNPLLYQPEALRENVIDIYGFAHFQKTLYNYLEEFFTSQNLYKVKL
jgi:glycosyltransferase involved in cell wall biosynthesis